jgi:uncharacterized SAM-binding protein YcdF (DUF218 family)
VTYLTYIQPLLFLFLVIAGIGLYQGPRSRGKRLVAAGLTGIFLVSWPPADWMFSRPLEAQYPVRPFAPVTQLQALVVLGEGVDPPNFEEPYPVPGNNTYRRCEHAAWIYSRYGPLPILVSGGRTSRRYPTIADTMAQLLRGDGIPESMIWTEDRSHSTYENALYSAMILREHGVSRIALIVDAVSMPRAAACFRKLGIDVTPAPCDYRTMGPWRDELLPNWTAIRRNEDTLHEILGLAWYKARGWI